MIPTFPEKKLNGTKYPDWTFAYFVAKRIMVVLKHARKLFSGTRLQECQSKMSKDAAEKLGVWIQGMANKVSLDPPSTVKQHHARENFSVKYHWMKMDGPYDGCTRQ